MKFKTILYRVADGIAEIRLNRPHRLNAVIEQLYDDILAALDASEVNVDAKVIVLTGEGRAFCVGADLKEHATGARSDFEKRQYLIKGNDVCARLRRISKPVIAAVNGYALGAGAEISVSSDFLLMKESAQIGFPEVSIGTFVGGAITQVLPQLVGLAMARELIFTGRRITGPEAVDIRLASRSFADDAFEDEVNAFARNIASFAPLSMALAKKHLNTAFETPFDSVLVTELEGICACMATRDWQEGIDAFAEKRHPEFTGK